MVTWATTTALLLIGLSLYYFTQPTQNALKPGEELRIRGAILVTPFLKHGQEVLKVTDPQLKVSPKDAMLFHVHVPSDGYLAIFFLDEKNNYSWFYPSSQLNSAAPIKRGEHEIPGSAIFDESPLDERVFVLYAKEEKEIQHLAEQLKLAWEKSGEPFSSPRWLTLGDGVWSMVLKKK